MSDPWSDSVDLARERLKWATARIEEFHREAQSFLDQNPYDIIAYHDDEGGEKVRISCKLFIRNQIPIRLRLMVGEIVNNLRATVDNLVWSAGQKFDAGERLALMYANSAAHFNSMKLYKKVGNLPPELRDWLVNEQTYSGPDKRPLWYLTQLWNEDKHRVPSLMATAIRHYEFTAENGPVTIINPATKQLGIKDGDEVFGCTTLREQVMNFNTKFALNVGFSEIPAPDAVEFLAILEHHIRLEVLPKFEPFML